MKQTLLFFLLAGLPLAVRADHDVEVIPAELRGVTQPQAAMADDGKAYVAFGRGSEIFCAAGDAGLKFKPPVKVGELPKLALGMRRSPRVAWAGGAVVVSAISHTDGNLYAWSSSDGAATWSAPARVNSVTNSAREGMHAMVSDGKGLVYAAWLDLRNKGTELWGASSRDGGRTWSRNFLIYQSPDGTICQCCHPTLASDGAGRLWAMWRNAVGGSRDLYFASSRDGGETFSSATKLGSGTWRLNACPMDGGHALVLPDGELLTTWRRDKSLFASDGKGERLLSAMGLHPVVGWNGNSPFYVWQEGKQLRWRQGDKPAELFASNGAFASVAAAAPSQPAVVVWEGNVDGAKTIFARRIE
jgi:BNR repeat-like domain